MNPALVARLLASTAAIAVSVHVLPVSAQSPQAPTVAAGSIAVTRQGATTVVTQGTEKGIIDWRSFSIGPQESVRFDQPGRSSITLNRVTSSEISRIDGKLSANGQVWLSNPNGVMIGPGGQVNVGGLLATTGRIDATEFLRSGRAAIDQIGKDAAIVNSGAITVGEGGYAALAAAAIRNDGVIAARSGSIALGSGKAVTVDFTGDKLITYQVTQPLDEAPAGAESAVSSNGTLAAPGGTVLLSARAAKGVMDNVINLKGLVVSNSVKVDGGTVVFGDGGAVQVSAKIDATSATGQGGTVAVLGEKVGLMDGAAIDASGATGGGTVLVGGDWQGLGEPGAKGQNAQVAYVAPTASIKAEAMQSGTGGKVVVWADDTTRFNGTINALGGSVETSGKKTLLVGPNAAVKAGAWLLDPTDITITTSGTGSLTGGTFSPGTSSTIDPATISAGLSTGDVTIQTAAGAGNGDIIFSSGTISTASGTVRTLKLLADRNVDIQAGAVIQLSGAAHNVTLNSGANYTTQNTIVGGIQVIGATITTTGGSISMVGGLNGAFRARGYDAVGAAFTAGVAVWGSVVDAGAGAITIRGEGSPNYVASGGPGVQVTNNGAVGATVTAGGGITFEGYGSPNATDNSVGLTVGNFVAGTATVVQATGTGTISLIGRRGSGNTARNIAVLGVGVTPTISSVGGNIIFDGSYSGGTGPDSRGVTLQTALVTTGTGTISITGTGAVSGGASDGVSLGVNSTNSTVSTTGTGLILVNGVAGGAGAGITNYVSTLTSTGGNITLTTDNLVVNSSNFSATGGTLTYQPTAGTVAIGVNGGAGTLQISSSALAAHTGGAIQIGRSDLTANISVAGAVILSQATFLRTGGGNIISSATIDGTSSGGQALTLNASGGTVTIGGNIGSTTALASLNVTAGLVTNPASSSFTVTTVGTQSWNAPLVLRGDSAGTFANFNTTNADIFFASTINSAGGGQEQSVNIGAGTGTVSLGGSVGATVTPINFFTYSGSGAGKLITNGDISSIRSQTYANSVVAQGATNFNANGFSITFNGSLDGPGAVTVDTVQINAQATFNGSVGAITPLASFTRTGGPTVFGSGATLVRSVGPQSYALGGSSSAAITLAAPSTTFSTTNAPISFAGPIDSASTLSYAGMTIAAGTGTVSFANNFGQGTNLASFTSTGTGTITLGGFHKTQGTQSYAGALLLQGSPTFGTNNADLIFSGPLNAATAGFQTLAANVGTGTVSLVGGVGITSALGSLAITSAALGGTIITTGAQTYSGPTRLATNTKLSTTNTAITFNAALDGPGGLDLITGGGTVTLSGAVGATTALAYLNKAAGAALKVASSVTTSGTQNYVSAVVLTGAGAFSTSNAAITFAGPVDGSTAGTESMTVSTGTGAISFGNSFGAATSLSSFTQVGTGTLSLGGPTHTTTGLQHYTGPVVLTTANVSFTSGSNLRFDAPINGSFAGLNQAVFNAAGTVTLAGGAGGSVALSNLTLSGPSVIGGTIATSGGQSYAGTVNLSGATTLSTPSGQVVFSNTVTGPHNLTVDANLTRIATASINTTGATQSYNGAVILDSDVILSGGTAILNGTVNSATGGQYLAANTNTVTFNAAVGGTTPLASLSTGVSVDALIGGAITTSGSQSYGGAVRLGGATTLTTLTATAGDVRFNGNVNSAAGSQSLVIDVGNGNVVSFAGSLGATTAINTLSITTTGSNVALPTTTASSLTVSTGDGTVTQTGALTVSGTASFMTSGGAISLNSFTNNFNVVSLSTTNSAAILDTVGGFVVAGAQASSLTLDSNSSVTQSAGISVTSLTLSGSGNFNLPGANTIGTLSGGGSGSVLVNNDGGPGLSVLSLSGNAITLTQGGAGNYIDVQGTISTAGAASLTAVGNVDVNGFLSAGSATLNTAGTISGLGTISVTSAPLIISANGGSIAPIVNGVSGPAVATSAFINVTSGSITVNGTTLSTTTPTVAPTTPSVASVPTVATVATIATVASVATVATFATVASVATVATIATVASVATVATFATIAPIPIIATGPTIPFLSDPGTNPIIRDPGLLVGIIPVPLVPQPNFDLAPNPRDEAGDNRNTTTGTRVTSTSAPAATNSGSSTSQNPSADSVRNTVTSTPSGALIPPSAPSVSGTGAPLISTPTVKVDAADTGGANGQVVASTAASGGGGTKTIVPGVVSEGRAAPRGATSVEVPRDQPPTINEEALLD